MAMSNGSSRRPGEVLHLCNLAMLENIRRAQDPAWRGWLERQQVVSWLGRRFGREGSPLEAMLEHAHALEEELRAALARGGPACRPRRAGRLTPVHRFVQPMVAAAVEHAIDL